MPQDSAAVKLERAISQYERLAGPSKRASRHLAPGTTRAEAAALIAGRLQEDSKKGQIWRWIFLHPEHPLEAAIEDIVLNSDGDRGYRIGSTRAAYIRQERATCLRALRLVGAVSAPEEGASIMRAASRGPNWQRVAGRVEGATRYQLRALENPFKPGHSRDGQPRQHRIARWPLLQQYDDLPANIRLVREQDPRATPSFFSACHARGILKLIAEDAPFDTAARLTVVESELDAERYFDPDLLADTRDKVIREIVQRRGQPQFRAALMEAFGARCALTGCDAPEALEAAHIAPYLGVESNDTSNGLLLRADIHTLFDLKLVSVCPITRVWHTSSKLGATTYASLDGTPLQMPAGIQCPPSIQALSLHWGIFRTLEGVA